MRSVRLLSVLAPLALTLAACTMSGSNTFRTVLNGTNERPTAVVTGGGGTVTATLRENTLTVEGTFSNLSGAATAAHIHGAVNSEGVAGVLFPLTVPLDRSGAISGTATLTNEQIAQLRDGLMYVNVHTPAYPGGEIRGQLR